MADWMTMTDKEKDAACLALGQWLESQDYYNISKAVPLLIRTLGIILAYVAEDDDDAEDGGGHVNRMLMAEIRYRRKQQFSSRAMH